MSLITRIFGLVLLIGLLIVSSLGGISPHTYFVVMAIFYATSVINDNLEDIKKSNKCQVVVNGSDIKVGR